MAIVDIATLKGYFNTGDVPTEAQFADLMDTVFSMVNQDDTYVVIPEAASLTIDCTKKSNLRRTDIATATDIGLALTNLTNGKTLDWFIVNASGSSRTITLPASVTNLDAGSAAQSYYATRVITLADTEKMNIFFKCVGTEIIAIFTKTPAI